VTDVRDPTPPYNIDPAEQGAYDYIGKASKKPCGIRQTGCVAASSLRNTNTSPSALIDTINNIDTVQDKEEGVIGRVYEYFLGNSPPPTS
jgi:hypothetical protein